MMTTKSLIPSTKKAGRSNGARACYVLAGLFLVSAFVLPDGNRHRTPNAGFRTLFIEAENGERIPVSVTLLDEQERFPLIGTPYLTRNAVAVQNDRRVRIDPAVFKQMGVPDADRLPESILNGRGTRRHVYAMHVSAGAIIGFAMQVLAVPLLVLGLILSALASRRANVAGQRRDAGECIHCGYPITTRQCPECGRIVDPYPDV